MSDDSRLPPFVCSTKSFAGRFSERPASACRLWSLYAPLRQLGCGVNERPASVCKTHSHQPLADCDSLYAPLRQLGGEVSERPASVSMHDNVVSAASAGNVSKMMMMRMMMMTYKLPKILPRSALPFSSNRPTVPIDTYDVCRRASIRGSYGIANACRWQHHIEKLSSSAVAAAAAAVVSGCNAAYKHYRVIARGCNAFEYCMAQDDCHVTSGETTLTVILSVGTTRCCTQDCRG
jgi:hypothetical protein